MTEIIAEMTAQQMKAALFNQYGDVDVLQIGEVPEPRLETNSVLVKVHAAAINPKDTFIRKGRFKRFTGTRFPQLTGFDFAGEITESNVSDYAIGERVFGMLGGWHGGSVAEYVLAQANQLAKIPDSLSFTDAAALPLVTLTALQALRDEGNIQQSQRVCINGASGGVGSMAVQIAKIWDCHITAIANKRNHDFLYSLGADTCIDYKQNDIRQSNQPFDIFFDVFGNTRYREIQPILTKNGTWVSTVLRTHVFISQTLSMMSSQSAQLVVVKAIHSDLAQIADWVQQGQLKAVVQNVYPLAQIAAAHQQQQSKHTRGKLVITL